MMQRLANSQFSALFNEEPAQPSGAAREQGDVEAVRVGSRGRET